MVETTKWLGYALQTATTLLLAVTGYVIMTFSATVDNLTKTVNDLQVQVAKIATQQEYTDRYLYGNHGQKLR